MINLKFYKNKKRLIKEYVGNKNTIKEIAVMCSCSEQTIHYWMEKFNIQSRRQGARSRQANLSPYATHFIEGELLGDGCIIEYIYSASYRHGSKYKEYLIWLSQQLKSFGIEQAGKINKVIIDNRQLVEMNKTKQKYKRYISYRYASKSYVELLDLRHKWYLNGKKRVPPDLQLTPVTVRQWFIGDGGCYYYLNSGVKLYLCTMGFPKEDVLLLMKKLKDIGIETKITKRNNIGVYKKNIIKKFFDYIGDCPVDCYKYKWLPHTYLDAPCQKYGYCPHYYDFVGIPKIFRKYVHQNNILKKSKSI